MTTDDLRWQARVSGWECGVQLDLDALQHALLHDPNRLPLLASLSSGGVTSPNTAPPRLGTFPALDFQLTSGLQSPRLYPRLHSSLPLPYRRWEERFDPLPKRRAERVSGSSDPEGSPDGSRSSSPVADSFRSARSNLTVASTELRPALNTTPLLDTSSAPAGAASSPAPEIAPSEIAPPATATVTALPSAPATAPITPSRPSPKTSSSALLDDRARAEMGANEAAPPPAAVRTVSFAASDAAVASRSISLTSDVAVASRSISLPAPSFVSFGDAVHAPVEGIVHRYPDRVLLKLLHACPVYCRFCFRRESVGPGGEALSPEALARALAYIRADARVWEAILTGGDPLAMSPRRLQEVARGLGDIAHVQVMRVHTRVPAVAPERIDAAMIAALKSFGRSVYVALHANHPRELTPAARAACARLVDAGVPMVSQTVLLKGVNDDPDVLGALMRAFVESRVKPYYLHHADLAPGTAHLRVDLARGREIVAALRGRRGQTGSS